MSYETRNTAHKRCVLYSDSIISALEPLDLTHSCSLFSSLSRLADAEGLMALGHHAGAIMPLNKAIFLCPDGGRDPCSRPIVTYRCQP